MEHFIFFQCFPNLTLRVFALSDSGVFSFVLITSVPDSFIFCISCRASSDKAKMLRFYFPQNLGRFNDADLKTILCRYLNSENSFASQSPSTCKTNIFSH